MTHERSDKPHERARPQWVKSPDGGWVRETPARNTPVNTFRRNGHRYELFTDGHVDMVGPNGQRDLALRPVNERVEVSGVEPDVLEVTDLGGLIAGVTLSMVSDPPLIDASGRPEAYGDKLARTLQDHARDQAA